MSIKTSKILEKYDSIKTALFIMKITLFTFGGGNVLFPLLKKKFVDEEEIITEKKFDQILAIGNTIPGPTAVQVLACICIRKFGRIKGSLVCTLSILPHIFLALLFFHVFTLIKNKNYIFVFTIAVIPVVIVSLFSFFKRYVKISLKDTNF